MPQETAMAATCISVQHPKAPRTFPKSSETRIFAMFRTWFRTKEKEKEVIHSLFLLVLVFFDISFDSEKFRSPLIQ